MCEFISASKMRELERAAFDSGSVSGLELMERAGRGVVEAILKAWSTSGARTCAIVLCGPGNNGGDGFVVARLLHNLGWHVTVFFYGSANSLPPDARYNHDRWNEESSGKTVSFSFPDVSEQDARTFAEALTQNTGTVLVDALFGIGLTRSLLGLTPILQLIEDKSASDSPCHVVSIDVPSGLAEEGPLTQEGAKIIQADLTVTFHQKKVAHKNGAECCGDVVVADIGL